MTFQNSKGIFFLKKLLMVTISFWALLYPTTFSLKSANVKETIKK